MRRKAGPNGHTPPPEPPEIAMLRAAAETRIGVCYTWQGKFGKAALHLQKALDVEDEHFSFRDREERAQLERDLARVKAAASKVEEKAAAAQALQRASSAEEGRAVRLRTPVNNFE